MSNKLTTIDSQQIQSRIFALRGVQVMLDRDLAELYGVETKVLNQAVKRNIDRFPERFRFQLSREEYENLQSQIVIHEDESLRSQIVTSRSHGGRRYLPYVFTEQGVSMLSAVLHSKTAIKVSVQIMDAFVQMRRFIAQNATIFQRLDTIERKQLVTETRLDKVFDALEAGDIKSRQGIFFDGQIFDAYVFVSDLIKSAKRSIVLIDNYIDETVLLILAKRNKSCSATIYTKTISKQLRLDLKKHNQQYAPVEIKQFKQSHDRFLILDNSAIYHFGASLKDLGKKWFAFSKFDKEALVVLGRLGSISSRENQPNQWDKGKL